MVLSRGCLDCLVQGIAFQSWRAADGVDDATILDWDDIVEEFVVDAIFVGSSCFVGFGAGRWQ